QCPRHGHTPMRSYRLPAAALALLAAIGCGGDSGPSNAAPIAKFSFACTLLDCTFTNASTDADGTVDSYSWTFGDAANGVSTVKDPVYSFAAPGAYHVKLTATDNDGLASAVADSTVTVTDVPNNTNPTANFTFSCTGLDCTFTDASSDPDAGDAITAYDWDFGDGTAHATTQSPTHTFIASSATTEQVTLTVTDTHAGTGAVTKGVPVTPGGATCGNGSTSSVSCPLTLTSKSTVTITLTSVSCNANGNTLKITSPIMETVFTDGCHTAQGTVYTINGGAAFSAGVDLLAEVTSGSTDPNRIPPAVSITGSFPTWTLNFDDGEDPTGPGEPDFNDLVITVNATVVP
ncbi:MAG: PKD domain-containing protein, partial [bacterium]